MMPWGKEKRSRGADSSYSWKEAARAHSIFGVLMLAVALSTGLFLFFVGGTGAAVKFSHTKAEGWTFDFSATGLQIVLALVILLCIRQANGSFNSAREVRTRSLALAGRLAYLVPEKSLSLVEKGPPQESSKPETGPAYPEASNRQQELPLSAPPQKDPSDYENHDGAPAN